MLVFTNQDVLGVIALVAVAVAALVIGRGAQGVVGVKSALECGSASPWMNFS